MAEPTSARAATRDRILELLGEVAPDVDPGSIAPGRNFRDQFDFDSMDTLHFATAISRDFGIEIPESDYASFASLDSACAYVLGKLGSA
jgi:acyl carrier protein